MKRTKLFRDLPRGGSPLQRQVGFKFGNNVSSENKKNVLRCICSWKEVKSVQQVFENTGVDLNDSMLNLYILFVKRSGQAEPILKKLRAIPEIEYAYLPPVRSPR